MVFVYKDYFEKWKKCKHRVENLCRGSFRMTDNAMDMIANCGNCRTNTEEPNLF